MLGSGAQPCTGPRPQLPRDGEDGQQMPSDHSDSNLRRHGGGGRIGERVDVLLPGHAGVARPVLQVVRERPAQEEGGTRMIGCLFPGAGMVLSTKS